MRGLLAFFLLAGSPVIAVAGFFADRVQDSLPEGVRLTAMNCRGNVVVIRGASPDEARLSAFMRSLSGNGISADLHLTSLENDSSPPVLTFMLHARSAKPSGADVCAGLPDRFPVVRSEALRREVPAPCPGARLPQRVLDRQSVETLHMVGVMTKEDTGLLYAIVQGTGEQVHRVRVGDRLGAEDACVLAITADGLTVGLPGGKRKISLATE